MKPDAPNTGGRRGRIARGLAALATVSFVSLGSGVTAAQTVGPSTQPSVQAPATPVTETSKIGAARRGSRSAAEAASATPISQQRSIGFDLGRMAIALGIVIGLIFGVRWILTHFFVNSRAPATSRAVKILGRTSLAPRQQVLLLQVGRRVVVVGESNGQLATLAQLDDPDEVASLVGQLQEEQMQRAASFGGLFGRMQKKLGAEEEDEHAPRPLADLESPADASGRGSDEPSVEPTSEARSELSNLVDKVRAIRNQLGR